MFDDGRMVTIGDTALFVSEAGKPEGEPILLLHGGLGSRLDFEPLARHLADDYRLIALDSRGHGRSAPGHAAMSYRQLAEDCAAALVQRFSSGRLSARDMTRILAAGLRAGGNAVSEDEVAAMRCEDGAAGFARIVSDLLSTSFGAGGGEAAGPNP